MAACLGLPRLAASYARVDIDREARIVHVRRRFSQGELKQGRKTDGSTRTVPLRQRVLDALDTMPTRIDTKLLFPAPRGGYIDLERFRHREWAAPGVLAAKIDHRRIYDCRHTFATWAIEDGRMSLIHLATIMGTSVRQIEDTLLPLAHPEGRSGADVPRRVRRHGSDWLKAFEALVDHHLKLADLLRSQNLVRVLKLVHQPVAKLDRSRDQSRDDLLNRRPSLPTFIDRPRERIKLGVLQIGLGEFEKPFDLLPI